MGMSWSRTRKILEEDLLCEKLRGRVQYFFTIYHNAPDQYGRFAIRVDGNEIFQANPYNEIYYDKYLEDVRKKEEVPLREWDGKDFIFDEVNRQIEEKAALLAIEDGKADSYDVMRSVNIYLSQQVEESLKSDNLLLRMFAILDRRIGRRTLIKLVEFYKILPEWIQPIYELRFAVEGISVNNKSKLLLSADGDISLYEVDDRIINEFEELLDSFVHGSCYNEQDFVDHIKRKCGENAIRFILIAGCYPELKPEYKNVMWYNF